MAEYVSDDGEVIETISDISLTGSDTSTASAIARTEIDSQVATARRYPRSIKTAMTNILTLATLDEDTATECIYALKRGGKPIRGPSIRLAEIISSQWGNCRDTATVVSIDRVNKLVVSEGTFLDLETNRGTRSSVSRRISDKYGKIYNDDMIAVTGNAANSIARRNAILAGVPKGVWRKAVEACEQIIRGDTKTMVERRDAAIKALAHFNLSPEQVFKIMEVQGVEDINLDDLATLRVIYTSLRNGDQTVEELLRGITPDRPERVTATTAKHTPPTQFASDVPTADGVPQTTLQPDKKPDDGPAGPAENNAEPNEPVGGQAAKKPDKTENDTSEPNRILGNMLDLINKVRDRARLDAILDDYADDIGRLDPSRKTMIEQVIAKKRTSLKR